MGAKAGVALTDYCTSAAAIDYDRDGWPDLYVLVYGRPDHGPNLAGRQRAAQPPLPQQRRRHVHRRHRRPRDADDTRWGLALESADLDGDGWPDIYVANDFGKNTYLHNNGDGTFTNLAKKAGVLDPGFGMGVAIDDYDGDGKLDFYVSNYSFPLNWFLRDSALSRCRSFPTALFRPLVWRRLKALSRGSSLFRARGDGTFERTSDEADVWDTSWSWGCVFVDADLDGRPDLFVVNGMVTGKNAHEREIDFWNLMSSEFKKFEKGIPIAEFGDDSLWGRPPKRFYRNRDGRHFDELAAVTGLESDAQPARPRRHRRERRRRAGSLRDGIPPAAGALDQPQSVATRRRSSWTLEGDFRARQDDTARPARPSARSSRSRRAECGARRSWPPDTRSSPRARKSLFFGLGDRDRADRVTVRWPSGRVTELRDVPAGQPAHLRKAA